MPPGIKMEIESRDLTKNTAVHNNVTIVLAICICVIVVRLLDGYHREESAYRSNYLAPPPTSPTFQLQPQFAFPGNLESSDVHLIDSIATINFSGQGPPRSEMGLTCTDVLGSSCYLESESFF